MAEFRNRVAGLTRRTLLAGVAAGIVVPAHAADHPAIAYMRKVAKDMLNAHRQGTVASFRRAIQRHADVAGIGDYSLGQYRPKLSSAQRDRYYAGVASFMARYFADQSREYPVAKYEIGEAASKGEKSATIATKVFLMSGKVYTVVWQLDWKGKGYKVTDAKILGFSMVYMQRGLFTSFLSKRNGDVGQLVAALNR